jgi:hypothetical protein
MGGNAHRLLTRRGIGNQEDFLRFQEFLELLDFFDKRRVDLLSPSRIENLDVAVLLRGPVEARRGRAPHIFLLGIRGINRHFHLPAQRRQLFNRSGSLQIASDQERCAALFLQVTRKLGGRRRFARAVQPDH